MREWQLRRDQLPSLILAADARFGKPNYIDDQIWELDLSSGEPAALSLRLMVSYQAKRVGHCDLRG